MSTKMNGFDEIILEYVQIEEEEEDRITLNMTYIHKYTLDDN